MHRHLFGSVSLLHTSVNSFQLKNKYSPQENMLAHWKQEVYEDAGSFLDLEWSLPAIWSLSMLWNSLKEKSVIFLIFKNSHYYLEFLIPGKGSLLGTCHKRAACRVCFPPTVCGQLPTQLHPYSLPKGSLVALPTQGLFVMKSFKIVSQSGENTCFWSIWRNTFP